MTLRPAAFIDRDGVLNEDTGYVHRSTDFHWLEGVFEALTLLRDAGRALVVVTNQSGIARGLYTEDDHARLCDWMREDLRRRGLAIDAIYHCPHLPKATVAAYRVDCDCRKPRPGLILRACADLRLDPAASCLFGDKPSDIAAGRAAGVGHNRLIAASPCGPRARTTAPAPVTRGEVSSALRVGHAPDGVHPNLLDAVRAELSGRGGST